MDFGDDDEIIVPIWNVEAEVLPFEDYDSPAPKITVTHAESWEILYHVWFILESLLAVIFFFAITRVFGQKTPHIIHPDSIKRYLYEFLFILAPTVLFVIVLHHYVYAVIIVFAISVIYALFMIYKTNAQQRWYITGGRRPFILTLNRATIYLITALCILAEDFQCFPKYFQMSHGHSIGLKDALAGFYVFTMATVERNKNKIYGVRRTLTALVLLWLGEYVGSKYIIYSHDENVYGEHWNIFVTLALTKCIGTFYCSVFKSRTKQLYVGGVLLILHQCALRVFSDNVVLDSDYVRDNLFSQNREGLLSLPGFVALYFISVYIGRCLRVQDIILSYYDVIHKVKSHKSPTCLAIPEQCC
ncbi:GPI-anchored wall transfer protein 1-like [Bactrocera tryoni]|uniref:GPI-anchored wall transfer protein 1-like n=1 Tax=Bactrocera tryoni TaxID=59916 RepID=UPI001A966CDE|nr:GPI-anchored wall transfer protein 1-like [Bactrocera tryoni]